MNELFLFVRPPRPLWPFNSPASAFWPPLAFASLAAALRDKFPKLRVEILDAPALEMGWKTLEGEILRRRPSYVGIGEEAVSCVEGLRLSALAKTLGARVIAGGCFFGHVAPQALATGLIDAVVHGEGEITIVELVEALREGQLNSLRQVAGVSFQDDGDVVTTSPRDPIADLDTLPFPAYDLLPVERYGARSRNHAGLAALELGRGCVGTCSFCVLWRQMGRFVGDRPTPLLRVKSPERSLDEIRRLTRDFSRRYVGWVDPCFNAHPDVPARLAELLLRNGAPVGQSAWMRTDHIVRDAASGALAACVRSGLNEVYLGVERPDADGVRALRKSTGPDAARQALSTLTREFPGVLTIGSFIYGLPGDTPATVRAIHRLAIELQLDQFFFIPLTPLPGTEGWRPELWDPTGRAFRRFNFLPSAQPGSPHAVLERALFLSMLTTWPAARIRSLGRRVVCGDARKRRVSWRLYWRGAQFHLRRLGELLSRDKDACGMVFPAWYER